MPSRQGETFQEIIQRYNRELMKLQKKAAAPEEMEVITEMTPPTSADNPAPLPDACSDDVIIPLQEDAIQAELDTAASQDTYVDYNPGPLAPIEDGGAVTLPDEIPVGPDCVCPPDDSGSEWIPQPDVSGCAAGDALHSQTVGPDGPVLLQDGMLHELLEEVVFSTHLPRPIHQKGWGALGNFRCLRAMSAYTQADFLREAGRTVPVAVRFSQASGGPGAPDSPRNIRGMSAKFYTDTGNFDLICNSLPVLFIRDAIRFPEAIAAFAPSPASNLPDPQRFWEFIARTPEAVHFLTWYYSDMGTIQSYRRMRAYGVNTFVWRNSAGERKYVKYHWIPLLGERYMTREEAERRMVRPDLMGKELHDAIAGGQPVEYDLAVQLMDPADAGTLSYDPLDCTKVWSERNYPLITVGRMTLNRNPENYQEQVEDLAFSPANLVEGIELSRDRVLQGRSFLYWDSQRRRLGADFRNLPVNRPLKGAWTPEQIVTSGEGTEACGQEIRSGIAKPENFAQAGERYQSMDAAARERLSDNIAWELYRMPEAVQACVIGYLYQASPELATQVRLQADSYARQR